MPDSLVLSQAGAISSSTAPTFDVLLIDADVQRALFTLHGIESSMQVRCVQRASGRAAISSYERARFDAIVCRSHLGDIACLHWIRMIRGGRFGYSATPVIVLCDEVELQELGPMTDEHTALLPEGESGALAVALQAIRDGADKPLVLVVEDELRFAQTIAAALSKAYRVELAYDGRTALQMWRERRHALVLLDLMLPDMSGQEILMAMKNEHSNQVVVVLTAHDAPKNNQELMLAGASDFLSKPLDTRVLPEVCAQALRTQKCLGNVERSRAEAASTAELRARVRVANYHIERGQVGRASAHLRSAIHATRGQQLDDDQWAMLMAEFDV
jgi:DNA-binding response OmpR family regulator